MKPSRVFLIPGFVIAVSAMLSGELCGCLWDRDTLAQEAKSKHYILEVTSGRFERFPDLYYEMRLKRVAEAIESTPEKLDLYDDAGVAADRLHRGDEAIQWMATKKEFLDESDTADEEHLYRYHANLGTFLFHDWMRKGATKETIEQALSGRDHITQAIKINPDAHFGREKVQLKAMNWVIGVKNGQIDRPFLEEARYDSIHTEGLAGLIRLGDAWRSPDIFYALSQSLLYSNDASLAMLAHLRTQELLSRGTKSILPDGGEERLTRNYPGYRLEDGTTLLHEWYTKARLEADLWHKARTDFLETKLGEGLHPDTHSDFWGGFEYSGRAPRPPVTMYRRSFNEVIGTIMLFALLLAPLALLFWFIRRIRRAAVSG